MRAPLPADQAPWESARRIDPSIYLAAVAAVAVAVIAVYMPTLALPALGAAAAVFLLNLGARLPRMFLGSLLALLIGYAFLGRGLAHVGAPPIYVGEMVLGLGVLAMLTRLDRFTLGPFEVLILAFMGWGALRTLPFYGQYGTDSLRDAVLWAYAIFALAIPVALGTADRTRTMLRTFQTCLPFFLIWVPVMGLIASTVEFPHGPGSEVGIVAFKGGDMGVHLGGAAAFLALGLYSETPGWRWPAGVLWASWLAALVVAGGLNRGGLVAAGISLIVASAMRPSIRMVQGAGIVGLIVLVAAIADLRVDIGQTGKQISVDEMAKRITSVFGNEDEALEGTRTYRLEWWDKIVDYTFGGEHFWGGKGFGINLATDDGFQFDPEESHRAPHNSHMTVLARMGVPGLAMWIGLQVAFAASLWVAMRKAQSLGLARWASIDAWILIYWLAICLNTSFDPYLEGPQGGIWYWSIVGIGLYVLRLQRVEIEQVERAQRRRTYTIPPQRPPSRSANETSA